jgi:predicted ribosomally synthesized peptide with SipW-like signal peptide
MKKRAILIVGLALAIAAAGVAYAAWTDTLNTNAQINTGNVAVSWAANPTTDDPAGSNDPSNTIRCTGGNCAYETGAITRYSRNVGQCDVVANGDTLTITIGNAYPSYHCSIHAAAVNSGSIPIKPSGATLSFTRWTAAQGVVPGNVVMTADSLSWPQTSCVPAAMNCPWGVYFDGNSLGAPDIMFDVAKGIGTVLDPGASGEVWIWFHVEPEAEQSATYTMTMTWDFGLFNA